LYGRRPNIYALDIALGIPDDDPVAVSDRSLDQHNDAGYKIIAQRFYKAMLP